jgi:ankyrin repeat protein
VSASKHGNLRFVKFLLGKGPDINRKDYLDFTALLQAVVARHFKVATLLVRRGANLNVEDAPNEFTPLMHAAWYGYLRLTKLLLDHGADVNHVNNDGWTALIIASETGHEEIVQVLLDHGAGYRELTR